MVQEINKPSIRVRYTLGAPQEILWQLQYGMEEEGIPWESEVGASDAQTLAWEAARDSRLEVGIGLDRTDVVLQYAKLDQGQPLFQIPANSGEDAIRALGANAARLVKKLPLKAMDRR